MTSTGRPARPMGATPFPTRQRGFWLGRCVGAATSDTSWAHLATVDPARATVARISVGLASRITMGFSTLVGAADDLFWTMKQYPPAIAKKAAMIATREYRKVVAHARAHRPTRDLGALDLSQAQSSSRRHWRLAL